MDLEIIKAPKRGGDVNQAPEVFQNLFNNVRKVIVGKDEQIRLLLCCWFSGGHLLIEDCPGTGKTILARAIAKSAKVDFKRVQFTPDLLPSDLLGSSIYRQDRSVFEFLKGPVFTTLLLGDELNRATPRTQSALLEGMAEGQVTVEGRSFELSPLFFVIATQNPVEQHGTFPLPEAQLDRFMFKISMGYPQPEDEIAMIRNQNQAHPIHSITAVENEDRIKETKAMIPKVQVSDKILSYVTQVVAATRKHPDLKLGASPRATLALIRASQTLALMDGQSYVRPNHITHLVKPVLTHRLMPTPEARIAGKGADKILEALLKDIPVPVA